MADVSCFTQYTHTATVVARLHYSRREAVNVGEFEEQDAAVVQAWHERDVEDAEYYAHRLGERQHENAGRTAQVADAVVHRDDTALDRRIARARMFQRTMSHLDATSVEDLEAYSPHQNSLIIHYHSLTKLCGVDHLKNTLSKKLALRPSARLWHESMTTQTPSFVKKRTFYVLCLQ